MAFEYKKDNLLDLLKEIKAKFRKKELESFYFLYGNEGYFIEEIEKNIKKIFVDDTGLNKRVYKYENFDILEAIKYIATLPLMNEKKLIIFDDIDYFNNNKAERDKNEKALLKALDEGREYNVIVIIERNEAEKRKEYQNLYGNGNIVAKFFAENGVLIDLHKLNEEDLNKHIVNRFVKAKIEIDKVEAAYIIRNAGKNLKSLYNECDKIISYVGDKSKVVRADIDAVLTKSIEDDVFNLIDLVNNNKIEEAISLYGDLISKDEKSVDIFYRFANNYKNLLITKSYMEKSMGQNEISKLMEMEPWRVNKFMSANKYVSKETLIKKVENAVNLSFDNIKGDIDSGILAELLLLKK